jgi:hypothetical protein
VQKTILAWKRLPRLVLTCAGEDTGAPYLTLRRLAVWVTEPQQRLRTLAALADSVEGLEGGKLISALDAATKHGEPTVSATVTSYTGLPPTLKLLMCARMAG